MELEDSNDIAKWYSLIKEAGMYAVLRPGSYICGERDYGGLPSWLMEIPGMSIRSDNEPFLDASRNYLLRLGSELKEMQVTEGGPILMAQVENEYGSFGDDHKYTAKLADIMRETFNMVLYTSDGGSSAVAAGQVHNVLAEIDGPPMVGFEAREKYITDPTSLGPLLDGEYYTTWLDIWAPNYTHQYTGYEHEATEHNQGVIQPGDRPRDRILVYVNNLRMGVMDVIYSIPNQVTVSLNRGDKLQLLVENMGRTDFGFPQLLDTARGIKGDVTIGGKTIQGWDMYQLPLETVPSGQHHGWHGWNSWRLHPTSSPDTPAFYSGTFRTHCRANDPSCDTFISIPNGIKGQVWVNGFNLGRYWIVGPQQSLYLPAPVLKSGWWKQNEIVALELEPKEGTEMIARGLDERVWENNPDPDRSQN